MHVPPSNKQCNGLSSPISFFAFSGVFGFPSLAAPSFRAFFGGVQTAVVVTLCLFLVPICPECRRFWLIAGSSPSSLPQFSPDSPCWLKADPMSTLPSCCSAMTEETEPQTAIPCEGTSHSLSLSSACNAVAKSSVDSVVGGRENH